MLSRWTGRRRLRVAGRAGSRDPLHGQSVAVVVVVDHLLREPRGHGSDRSRNPAAICMARAMDRRLRKGEAESHEGGGVEFFTEQDDLFGNGRSHESGEAGAAAGRGDQAMAEPRAGGGRRPARPRAGHTPV